MVMKAIVNGAVCTPEELFAPGVVLIEGDTIAAAGPEEAIPIPAEAERLDATGMAVVPGLIDVHIHGLLGHDAMGLDLAEVIRSLPAYGVTSFVATTITLADDEIISGLQAMARILDAPPGGARCLGIHLEGPFLSPDRPGMATRDWFLPLTWERFERYQRAGGGWIRMVTFAPELDEAATHIPRLVAAGVVPAIGHSDATYEQVLQAVQHGLSHATHTFNAMRPLHHRRPGVVGAVLSLDQITAQLIADGLHVHPAVMSILLRAKGLDRVVLVSDASPLAGLPEGEYEWEHKTIHVRDGSCRLADGTIAGAHALLDTGVRTLVDSLDLLLTQALVLATCTPARLLGERLGQLAVGYPADLVLLDAALQPVLTLVAGDEVFRRGRDAWITRNA